jgi:hypothetical protein
MELTKEYFDEQLRNLATKDDLTNSATKDDLKGLATKNEINEIKTDVADLKKFVQTNMVTTQGLDDLRDELPTRADFNTLQQSVDGIAKHFQEQKQEQIVGASRSKRMESWIIKAAEKIGVEYKP